MVVALAAVALAAVALAAVALAARGPIGLARGAAQRSLIAIHKKHGERGEQAGGQKQVSGKRE